MKLNHVVFSLSLCLLFGCSATLIKEDANDIDKKTFGWVHGKCLAMENPNLVAGDELMVIGLNGEHKITQAKVGQREVSRDNCAAILGDRRAVNIASGYSFYTLEGLPNMSTFALSIVLVGKQTDLVIEDGVAYADMDGDGLKDTFGQCSTSEGINFYVSSGMTGEAVNLWEAYYYLGYDSKVTCF